MFYLLEHPKLGFAGLFKTVELSKHPDNQAVAGTKQRRKDTMAEKEPQFPLKAVTCGLIALIALTSLFLYVNSTASRNYEATYHNLYGSTPVAGGNYSFSPPISKYHAIDIALASDGWNQSSLQNMTVYAKLQKMLFFTNGSALLQYAEKENVTLMVLPNPNLPNLSDMSGIENLGEVTAPVDNYKPQYNGQVIIRYIWNIVVTQSDGGICIPPPGLCYVDASSGEIVPHGMLF